MSEPLLKLSSELRLKLKKPLGILKSEMSPVDDGSLVCVGDVVSEDAIQAGLNPKLVIYDGKKKRLETGVSEVITGYAGVEVPIENPAGTITSKAIKEISNAYEREANTKIKVEGEEDLLALPAIRDAPEGYTIVYGQPNEGVVEVKINKETRKKAEDMLEEMKKWTSK